MDDFQKAETQSQAEALLAAEREKEHLYCNLLQVILADLGEELRKRRDPEYTYTAAAIASFGAVTWGVATIGTISSEKNMHGLLSPSIIAAIGTLVITIAVVLKIHREHKIFMKIKQQQVDTAKLLMRHFHLNETELPYHFREVGRGRGYIMSAVMVVVAAIAAIAFCLAIYLVGF